MGGFPEELSHLLAYRWDEGRTVTKSNSKTNMDFDITRFKTTRLIHSISKEGIIVSSTCKADPDARDLSGVRYSARSKYVPVKGDRLFFMPGCQIPRIKVRDHCKTVGSAVVIRHEKATSIFMGKNTLSQMFRIEWAYRIGKRTFCNWLRNMYGRQDLVDTQGYNQEELLSHVYCEIAEIEATESPFVLMGFSLYWLFIGAGNIPFLSDVLDNKVCGMEKGKIKPSRSVLVRNMDDTRINLLASPNLYQQESLLEYLNTVNINQDMYAELRRMLGSSDDDNITLAMEIMSNCVYSESIVYLAMLLKRHWERIRMTRMVEHVNFSAMLQYMQRDNNNWHRLSYEGLKAMLVQKGLDNERNMEILSCIEPSMIPKQGELLSDSSEGGLG